MRTLPDENLPLLRQALAEFPRPDLQARAALTPWLRYHGVTDAPEALDIVTLHYQFEPLGEGRQHYREQAVVTGRMSLIEAVLSNWQGETANTFGERLGDWAGSPPLGNVTLVERLEPESPFSNASPYAVFNGLYRRTQPVEYGPATLLALRAEAFHAFVEDLDLHHTFVTSLDHYWATQETYYRRALSIGFIADCNRQVSQGSLDEQARRLIWQAAGLAPRARSLQLSMLNVYGYVSTSILCLRDVQNGQTILHIPGNSAPFHAFASHAEMQRWFAHQCHTPVMREALLAHFQRADWPDGLDFSGLRTALEGLAEFPKVHRLSVNRPGFTTNGFWDPTVFVDYRPDVYSPPITGNLFAELTQRQKQRAYADCDVRIVTNAQVEKARLVTYLNVAMNLLLPIAIIVPEITPLLLAGGLAQFGLGLDQAVNGRTLEEKQQGVAEQWVGLFNALPVAGEATQQSKVLFRYARQGFHSVIRPNAVVGEAIGPAPALATATAQLAFRESPVVSSYSAVITRIDAGLYPRFSALLLTERGLNRAEVIYDLASDTFISKADVHLPAAPRWQASANNPAVLVRLDTAPSVASDMARMATLHGLGIVVQLPLDYAPLEALARSPIPRVITSLWVGGQPLGRPFIEALSANSQAMRNSAWRYQILLSRQDPVDYAANHALLTEQAPQLLLRPLEDEAWFADFTHSPYFAQYQAALEGPARNFSSASDVLRYRALQHYGGLYLDADDRLLLPDEQEQGLPALDVVPLSTTADGLLLAPPVSNDQMGLYLKFNSSMIGSHPGNPTLSAISDRIVQRFEQDPQFYTQWHDAPSSSEAAIDYAHRLNRLSGPGVLNEVIDERLPWLRQLRETVQLLVCPLYRVEQMVNRKALLDALKEHVPLDHVAQMGHAHSWQHP